MRRLTGVGSDALLSLVNGPSRSATVVGAGPHATYLQLDEPDGELIALVSRQAVRVPCAVVLPNDAAPPPELVPGTAVDVGERAIRWAGGELTVARWWPAASVTGATGLPPAAPVGPDEGLAARVSALELAVGEHSLPAAVPAALEQTIQSFDRADAAAAAAAVVPVLGSGPGLTPSADDAVAGLLLTVRSWYGTDVAPLLSRFGALLLPHLDRRTTAVSAGLLRHAAEGRGAPEVVRAVEHLTGRSASGDHDVLHHLVQLGHTSGRDTALGVLSFLRGPVRGGPARRATRPPSATDQPASATPDARPAVTRHDAPALESA